MAITAELRITIAEVEVTDEYRVLLTTERKKTGLAIDEAERLAHELIEAAAEARAALKQDFTRDVMRHGFDVDMAGEAG